MLRITTGFVAPTSAFDSFRPLKIPKAQERIASGVQLNSAADGAAMLSISERLQSQQVGDNEAVHNAMMGASLLQTAEGALGQSHDMLNRMRELSVQAANGTLNDSDRTYLQTELNQLTDGLDRLGDNTQFNGRNLLDGSLSSTGLSLQVGAKAGDTRTVTLGSVKSGDLGVSGLSIASQDDAMRAVDTIDKAIGQVSSSRSQIGAHLNGIEATVSNLQTTGLNLTEARSRIADADIGAQATDLAAARIRSQSSLAMQAQSNMTAGSVLRLLH